VSILVRAAEQQTMKCPTFPDTNGTSPSMEDVIASSNDLPELLDASPAGFEQTATKGPSKDGTRQGQPPALAIRFRTRCYAEAQALGRGRCGEGGRVSWLSINERRAARRRGPGRWLHGVAVKQPAGEPVLMDLFPNMPLARKLAATSGLLNNERALHTDNISAQRVAMWSPYPCSRFIRILANRCQEVELPKKTSGTLCAAVIRCTEYKCIEMAQVHRGPKKQWFHRPPRRSPGVQIDFVFAQRATVTLHQL
jgi:hypothetical protein